MYLHEIYVKGAHSEDSPAPQPSPTDGCEIVLCESVKKYAARIMRETTPPYIDVDVDASRVVGACAICYCLQLCILGIGAGGLCATV